MLFLWCFQCWTRTSTTAIFKFPVNIFDDKVVVVGILSFYVAHKPQAISIVQKGAGIIETPSALK